ncbi:chorismate mutase [Lentilactobacillus kosonis]|uniref:Chorismate mutase I n=1 Tax=Lentilactobacillus kosonis TaxID=2810561 RepID=A0A401FNQ9_9LACO|nr:chorismate mutase [Lentilactobacillus kosonis]GAY73946.1 chorismate mutase I [Lentilactobacillus kosonis]
MTELEQLRTQIDLVDHQLSDLLNQRFLLTELVAAVKEETGEPVLDTNRELKVINKATNAIDNPVMVNAIADIFQVIMDKSKQQQRNLLHQAEVSK